MNKLLSGALVLLALSAGCGGGEKSSDKSDSDASSSSEPKKKKAAASGSAATSAAAPAVQGDPAVVEAAKKVAACEFSNDMPKWDCEGKKAWDKSELFKDGAADATLVALLADADAKLQYVAADALRNRGRKYREDKALAEKVVAKLEAGQGSDALLEALGSAAGYVDAQKTGLGDKLKGMPATIKNQKARASFVRAAQMNNRDLMYPVTIELAKSEADENVRYAAVESFWTGTPNGKDEEVCQMWHDNAKDAKAPERVQSQAAYLAMFTSRGCEKVYDPLLKLIDEKAKGELKSNSWVMPLYFFVTNNKASEAQKKEALKLLKGIAENEKHNWTARTQALEGVAKADPKGAKAFLTKFKTNKEKFIAQRAEELLKKLDEEEKKKK